MPNGNLDLRKLTNAELIWLWRQRQPRVPPGGNAGAGCSAGQAAARLGIDYEVYKAAEGGRAPEHEAGVLAAIRETTPWGKPTLTPAELFALARRRSGERIDALCAALGGISKPSFYAMERGGSEAVRELWRARGYSL